MSADDREAIERQAQDILAAGTLGRTGQLRSLFEFLLARTLEGETSREADVAVEVFGRGGNFDPSTDATVRVYVHRLRRRLDEYYAGAGGERRLIIPKGEYGLALAPLAQAQLAEAPAGFASLAVRRWIALAAALVALNLGAWIVASQSGLTGGALRAERSSALWAPLLANGRPTIVVIGDYFIFGETDEAGEVQRLVRDFSINSRADLNDFLMTHPEDAGRYTDLDLHYLPLAGATALRRLLPLLSASRRPQDVRVIPMSELTAAMVKDNNVVYVGYLSGLGLLREPVFTASRFKVGESYDELIDTKSGKTYESNAGRTAPTGRSYLDYGYLSAFPGPGGGRIVVIAGTRDVAVVQTAEAAAGRAGLKDLLKNIKDAKAFEALYEVEGIRGLNLEGHLVLAAPIRAAEKWSARADAPAFPER